MLMRDHSHPVASTKNESQRESSRGIQATRHASHEDRLVLACNTQTHIGIRSVKDPLEIAAIIIHSVLNSFFVSKRPLAAGFSMVITAQDNLTSYVKND